jgi:hypothetical protein
MWDHQLQRRHGKAICKLWLKTALFFNGHIIDQVVLLAVTCDNNNNQILFSYAIVTCETEGTWVWFEHQLEQDFTGSYVLTAKYTKAIERHQFQGSNKNSGSLFPRCLK